MRELHHEAGAHAGPSDGCARWTKRRVRSLDLKAGARTGPMRVRALEQEHDQEVGALTGPRGGCALDQDVVLTLGQEAMVMDSI